MRKDFGFLSEKLWSQISRNVMMSLGLWCLKKGVWLHVFVKMSPLRMRDAVKWRQLLNAHLGGWPLELFPHPRVRVSVRLDVVMSFCPLTYSQCVPVADLGRTVQEFVPAPTMEPATPSTDRANVIQDGSAVTALSVSFVWEQLINHCIRSFSSSLGLKYEWLHNQAKYMSNLRYIILIFKCLSFPILRNGPIV